MQIRYLKDSLHLTNELDNKEKNNPPGLAEIRSSDCLNCHAFDGKLIGPFFMEISKRYSDKPESQQRLEKNIREVLTGVWGREVMPTHPQLSQEEVSRMVSWILQSATDPTVTYYRGTEGSFRIKPPEGPVPGSVLIISASYLDHGSKDHPKTSLIGEDVIVLKCNQ